MKTNPRKRRSIGVWGHNGTGNLGNEATISALIQNLRKSDPDILLYGFSWNPTDTCERHGIVSFPINRRAPENRPDQGSAGFKKASGASWKVRLKRYPIVYKWVRRLFTPLLELVFLTQSCRSIKDLDLMLIAGTGQVADSFNGARGYPLSLFRWSLCCRIKKVKWAVVSVGAGPINSPLSKRLIKTGLAGMVYRSFRDEYSKRLVENLGVKRNNRVFPDLVFSLDLGDCGVTLQQERPKTVAFNALPFRKPGSWENPSSGFFQSYRDLLVRFASYLVEEGYTLHLVPTQVPMDSEFLEDLRSRIKTNFPERLYVPPISKPKGSVEEVISQFSAASIVVTTRFHGVIFPYLLGRPVLALSVHPKITELMKDFGQERFCLDAEALDFDLLVKTFQQLEAAKMSVSNHVQEKVHKYRQLLDEQYRMISRL